MQALDAIGNKNAPIGSNEWCVSMHRQAMSHIDDAKTRVSWMRLDLKLIRDKQYYTRLKDKAGNAFADWADYCGHPRPWGLGLSVEVVEAMIAEEDETKLIAFNDIKRPAVTIRTDIAEYSRQAAAVLESSARWLGDHIQLHQKIDPEGEADLVLQPDDLKTTAENLANGAALLRWLADFEDKGGAA